MSHILLVTKYDFWLIFTLIFTSLLLLYFGEVKKVYSQSKDSEAQTIERICAWLSQAMA